MTEQSETKHTHRGFAYTDDVEDQSGGTVSVSSSSSATAPSIWLRTKEAPVYKSGAGESALHLSLDQATRLKDNLDELIKNHYWRELYPDYFDGGEESVATTEENLDTTIFFEDK